MKRTLLSLPLIAATLLAGCSNGDSQVGKRVDTLCGEKPNCVSTLETRPDFAIAQYQLTVAGQNDWQQIAQLALSLPGAQLGQKSDNYLRVECVSRVFQFVDDFEVTQQGSTLIVRSESRTGYSDFGVNRERADLFRQKLIDAKLITTNP